MFAARPIALPLLAALVLAGAALWQPSGAQAAGALDQLLGASPFPTATPPPDDDEPQATPTPSGAFFSDFTHSGFSGSDNEPGGVSIYLEGMVPGGKPGTLVWAAAVGTIKAESGSNEVTWYAPKGQKGPLEIPINVTLTGGGATTRGTLTVSLDNEGGARITKMNLPGLAGAPENFMGCLPAGETVRMADGTFKAIQAVRVGDKVAAYNQDTGKAGNATVEQVLVHNDKTYPIDLLHLADGRELHATGNHPLLTPGGAWKQVKELAPGDQVLVWEDGAFKAMNIASIVRDQSRTGTVYNLKTTLHDYVAAEVLVHNKCLAAGSRVDTPSGPVAVEALRPGMRVWGRRGGQRVATRVTNVYTKRTIAPRLPGKQLAPGLVVTANHLVWQGDGFKPAGEGVYADVAIAGTVYDLQTEAGNYEAGGLLMTASAPARTGRVVAGALALVLAAALPAAAEVIGPDQPTRGNGKLHVQYLVGPQAKVGKQTAVDRLKIEPGAGVPEHAHDKSDEIVVVVKGQGDFTLDGKTGPVKAGDTVFIPKGHKHALVVTGSERMEAIQIYDPAGPEARFLAMPVEKP